MKLLAAFVLVAAVAACTSTVSGQPTSLITSAAPPTRTAHLANLCALLDWPDLGYPGTEKAVGPTKTDIVPQARESCEWASQQFNAGYTPPPSPSCNNAKPGDVGADLSCVGDDAEQLAEIFNNSTFVVITIAYLSGQPVSRPTSYVDQGRTVYLVDAGIRCTSETRWDGATLFMADGDASRAFGSPCDEVKKLMTLLIQREPH